MIGGRMARTSMDERAGRARQQTNPAVASSADEDDPPEAARLRLAVPEGLLQLQELDVLYDPDAKALWTFMRPAGRPSFTPTMLRDFESWQDLIGCHFGAARLA